MESLFNTVGTNDSLDQNGFLLYEFRQSEVHPSISIEEIESMTAAIPPSSCMGPMWHTVLAVNPLPPTSSGGSRVMSFGVAAIIILALLLPNALHFILILLGAASSYRKKKFAFSEINSITGWRRKIAKKIFKLSNEIIEKNKRSNVFFEIPNHPFPFPNKLNYK